MNSIHKSKICIKKIKDLQNNDEKKFSVEFLRLNLRASSSLGEMLSTEQAVVKG